jgi:hypothetical protein
LKKLVAKRKIKRWSIIKRENSPMTKVLKMVPYYDIGIEVGIQKLRSEYGRQFLQIYILAMCRIWTSTANQTFINTFNRRLLDTSRPLNRIERKRKWKKKTYNHCVKQNCPSVISEGSVV